MKLYSCLPALAAFMGICVSCSPSDSPADVIFANDYYTVYRDRVVQGEFTAVANSPFEITSNYRSPADAPVSPVVEFRFGINGRNNELPLETLHYAVVGGDDKVLTLGVPDKKPETDLPPLGKNTEWTVKLDVSPMLNAFKADGYYVTATGDTIYADDFKGIWIAGNAKPMIWDYETMRWRGNDQLQPTSDPNIYSVTLTLNPDNGELVNESHQWKAEGETPGFPSIKTGATLVDAIYNMTMGEIAADIRPDSTFRAGKDWDGVWTRDISYSIYLALAYLSPQESMNSLKAKVNRDRIVQDTGTGGAWPVSSDRIVWAMAAWEIYKVTGDREWLEYACNVIGNSLADDEQIVFNKTYGLMHGEQSYLDWREQTYPKWVQPVDIYNSLTLGTNVMFAYAYKVMAMMCDELGINSDSYQKRFETVRDAINEQLWMPEKGFYAAYLYGFPYPIQSESAENLGQALAVIFDIASPEQASSLIAKTPFSPYGMTSIYPQIKDMRAYHNNAIWPFVQAYWNLAALKTRNNKALLAGIGAIYRAAAMFATNKELFWGTTGDYRNLPMNSDAQLWSVAGSAAIVFRIYAGMEFENNGIRFNPFMPEYLGGNISINGFKYRGSTIDLSIHGSGNEVERVIIDGALADDNFFAPTSVGKHSIEIFMKGKIETRNKVNFQAIVEQPATPVIAWNGTDGKILNYNEKENYALYINGEKKENVTTAEFSITPSPNALTEYMLTASDNVAEGYGSEPYLYFPAGAVQNIPIASYAKGGTPLVKGAKSSRYVETTTTKNTDIVIPVEVDADGEYFIDVEYSNGNGPINTENKCAIRTLIVNGAQVGPIIMPQRGIDEWVYTGYSNMVVANLKKGANTVEIKYITPQDVNMNVDVNQALLVTLRIIRKYT